MNLQKVLENLSLSEKEAKVYLALLELREALPSTIARRAKIKRPTAYIILEQLKKKGLTSSVKKSKRLHFQALNPQLLLEDQRDKYAALEKALPELLNLHQKYENAPQMSVFEGKEGLIKIMEDTLTASTDLFCFADVNKAVACLSDYYPNYIRKKVQRNIWVRAVVIESPLARTFQQKGETELREIYMVPKSQFPFKNEINIYDDKVAIISQDDETGVIIQNQNTADTQRSIFKMAFEYAKTLQKKA